MRISKFNAVFKDLYYNGTGWKSSATIEAWNKHWASFKNTMAWGCGNVDGTWYLYGLHGSVYLHPEVTNVTIIDSYVMEGMEKSYAVMDAEKFLFDAAKALGTTVGFSNYRYREIESF